MAPGSKSKHHSFEFFGPWGPALLILALPPVVYGLFFGCNASACLQLFPTLQLPSLPAHITLYSHTAMLAFAAWLVGLASLHLILPGKLVQGVVLPDGRRLTYNLNAFTILVLLYGGALYFGFVTRQLNLSWVYDNYLPLLTAAIICSTTLSIYLYVSSFASGKLLGSHGDTGYAVYDFWMGRELNPRVLGGLLDLKEWCELCPGMIGWMMLNLALAHKQREQLGYVTTSMILVNLFQLTYVVDALWNESAILTTMDITTDGFGFMLAFGDLVWVPFVFTTASRYLVDHSEAMSPIFVACVLGVKLLGYWIFRSSNAQKDLFRRNPGHPSVSHLRTLKTARGTQLIASSWWGASRHINYFGDWIMGVSWCLPCSLAGLNAVIPFFYCIYFGTLLIHRQQRDDAACKLKYGKDWDKYCAIVKYRIIPYVY